MSPEHAIILPPAVKSSRPLGTVFERERERVGSSSSNGESHAVLVFDNPLSHINILSTQEDRVVEALVTLDLIRSDDVPVNEKHALDLANSIKEEERQGQANGQLIPVLLGHMQGEDQFLILDGFHRNAAFNLISAEETEVDPSTPPREVKATIRLNCTPGEILDYRIIAAATHKSVEVPRMVEWAGQAWGLHPLSDKIRVDQAFLLRFGRGMTGRRLGLNPEEAEEAVAWVEDKSKEWHINPANLYKHLITANQADPELMKSIRERESGHKLEALTPNHLSAIARVLPELYALQRMVAEEIIRSKLKVAEGKNVALAVSRVNSLDEARDIIARGSWGRIVTFTAPKRRKPSDHLVKRTVEGDEATRTMARELVGAEEKVAGLMVENAKLKGVDIEFDLLDYNATSLGRDFIAALPQHLRAPFILMDLFDLSLIEAEKVLDMRQDDIRHDVMIARSIIQKTGKGVDVDFKPLDYASDHKDPFDGDAVEDIHPYLLRSFENEVSPNAVDKEYQRLKNLQREGSFASIPDQRLREIATINVGIKADSKDDLDEIQEDTTGNFFRDYLMLHRAECDIVKQFALAGLSDQDINQRTKIPHNRIEDHVRYMTLAGELPDLEETT